MNMIPFDHMKSFSLFRVLCIGYYKAFVNYYKKSLQKSNDRSTVQKVYCDRNLQMFWDEFEPFEFRVAILWYLEQQTDVGLFVESTIIRQGIPNKNIHLFITLHSPNMK